MGMNEGSCASLTKQDVAIEYATVQLVGCRKSHLQVANPLPKFLDFRMRIDGVSPNTSHYMLQSCST
jgi:hypothetical protein